MQLPSRFVAPRGGKYMANTARDGFRLSVSCYLRITFAHCLLKKEITFVFLENSEDEHTPRIRYSDSAKFRYNIGPPFESNERRRNNKEFLGKSKLTKVYSHIRKFLNGNE